MTAWILMLKDGWARTFAKCGICGAPATSPGSWEPGIRHLSVVLAKYRDGDGAAHSYARAACPTCGASSEAELRLILGRRGVPAPDRLQVLSPEDRAALIEATPALRESVARCEAITGLRGHVPR